MTRPPPAAPGSTDSAAARSAVAAMLDRNAAVIATLNGEWSCGGKKHRQRGVARAVEQREGGRMCDDSTPTKNLDRPLPSHPAAVTLASGRPPAPAEAALAADARDTLSAAVACLPPAALLPPGGADTGVAAFEARARAAGVLPPRRPPPPPEAPLALLGSLGREQGVVVSPPVARQ